MRSQVKETKRAWYKSHMFVCQVVSLAFVNLTQHRVGWLKGFSVEQLASSSRPVEGFGKFSSLLANCCSQDYSTIDNSIPEQIGLDGLRKIHS